MKKIIAISVMFALIAGAAFADSSVGGTVENFMYVFEGSTADGAKAMMEGSNGHPGTPDGTTDWLSKKGPGQTGYIVIKGQNDEGTFGGLVRANAYGGKYGWRNFAWWKPIPQLKLFLGSDGDGLFGTDPLVSWGYHQGREGFIATHDWGFWRGIWMGNWDGYGLAISVYPTEGVELNLALDPGDDPVLVSGVIPKGIQFNGSYVLQGTGKIFFTYKGAGFGNSGNINNEDLKDNGAIALSFLVTALDGIQIHPAFSTTLFDVKGTAKNPLNIGLAATYNSDAVNVKFRSAFILNGTSPSSAGAEGQQLIHVGIMPWFALDGLNVFISFDLVMKTAAKGAEAQTSFELAPYVRVPAGGGLFQAGLKIQNDGAKPKATTTYSVPVAFVYSF